MDTKKRMVPKVRFPEFFGDWEKRKLNTLMSFSNGFNGGSELYGEGVPFISVMDILNNNYITFECIRGKVNIDPKTLSRFSVEYGDVLFQRSSENVEDAGTSNVYISDRPAAFGGFVIRGKKTTEYDVYFMKNLLSSNSIRHQITSKAQGAQHINVSQEILSDVIVNMPSQSEQQRIGRVFASIDAIITLHQRKLDAIKEYKKGMLQKMFPKEGEKVPEIRFSGFTDNWEKKKLSDVLRITTHKNGKTFKREDVLSVSDEYGCVNQIRFQGRSFAGEDISNYKIVKTGDIIYTRSPLQAKPFGIIKIVRQETGIVSPLYIVNETVEGNDAEFLYRVFDLPYKTNNYLSPLVRKGAKNTMNISEAEWLSGEILVSPNYEEQKAIGSFFLEIDNLITLQQRKLDAMKEYKKGLLQQMFV